jgi:GH24 family phage-related lysozyme (muramidase)
MANRHISGSLLASIENHEGCRLEPYQDDKGNWTVGIGHNMKYPITREAAIHILKDDLKIAYECYDNLPQNITGALSPNRKDVFIEMIFQMGCEGFRSFKNMLKAAEYKDHETVYNELLDSQWARRYSTRADKLASKYRRG